MVEVPVQAEGEGALGQPEYARGHRRAASRIPGRLSALFVGTAVVLILVTLGWSLRIQDRLPNLLREDVEPSVLLPGTHSPQEQTIARSGDWFPQTIGDSTSLVTASAGSSISFRFHGTDLLAVVRVGPESGRLYLSVDGHPVSGLHTDAGGSYVSLRGSQAMDKLIPLAEGLAPGDHSVTLTAQQPGWVALASFVVSAATPFPWAATIMDIAGGALLFLLLRHMAIVVGAGSVEPSPARSLGKRDG